MANKPKDFRVGLVTLQNDTYWSMTTTMIWDA